MKIEKNKTEEGKFEKYSKENLKFYKEFLSYLENDLIQLKHKKAHSLIVSMILYIFCLYSLFVEFPYYFNILVFLSASIFLVLYNRYSISFIISTVCCEFSKADIDDIEQQLKLRKLGF